MVDKSADDGEALRERIRRALAGSAGRELVDIDISGPQVTVVVDEFSEEGDERTHVERALYSVHEEPNVNIDDESEPFVGGEHLEWSYLGRVEQTEAGWEQIEE
jgi:hypothetical protein